MNTQTNDINHLKDKVHLVSPSDHEHLLCIPHEQALVLLSDVQFDVFVEKNTEGIYTAHLEKFKMSTTHHSEAYALYKLATKIMDYTNAYINNPDLYLQSENHKPHYPYVLKAFIYREPIELLKHLTVTQDFSGKGQLKSYHFDSSTTFEYDKLKSLVTDARIASAKALMDGYWGDPMFDIKTTAEYTHLSIDHVIQLKKEIEQKNSDD
ncbi:TPA: hypothetical protein ROY42_005627 [Bacillus thuringiensis]|nr:hypothetical protein [Bacillus thuringiensis]